MSLLPGRLPTSSIASVIPVSPRVVRLDRCVELRTLARIDRLHQIAMDRHDRGAVEVGQLRAIDAELEKVDLREVYVPERPISAYLGDPPVNAQLHLMNAAESLTDASMLLKIRLSSRMSRARW